MEIIKFILRKIIFSTSLLIASISLIYVIARLIPGDPIVILCGESAPDPDSRKMLEERLDLNKPLYQQIITYMLRVFTGNWGKSIYTHKNVIEIVTTSYMNSIKLVIPSIVISFLVCLILSYIDTVIFKNNRFKMIRSLTISILSFVPSPIWATMVLMIITLSRLPTIHGNIMPPLIVLTITGIGILYKILRDAIDYTLNQPFIQYYFVLGYSRSLIYLKALRYSLPVILAALLYRTGVILIGAAAIETLFSYPGMGFLFSLAFSSRDYPLLLGWGIASTITLVIVYTAIDFLHMYLDPRVKID